LGRSAKSPEKPISRTADRGTEWLTTAKTPRDRSQLGKMIVDIAANG
jgi:hypothetical protein